MNNNRIEAIVQKILDDLNITKGTDIQLKKICDFLNVNLKESELKTDVSGLFIYKNNQGNILYNKYESNNRQRFTIAHELGHHVLHKIPLSMTKNEVKLFRDSDSSTGENKNEIEANSFAASLLMPEKFVHEEVENAPKEINDAIKHLAGIFKVSKQAMTFRLANLGYNLKGVV